MHWQTRLVIGDADRAANCLCSARVSFVSPGTVAMPHAKLGFNRALLVRDPDGHAVQLAELPSENVDTSNLCAAPSRPFRIH
jgi:hypothetical protein